VKVDTILKLPSIDILLFIASRKEVRYSELNRRIGSRGTLALLLRELEEEGMMNRRVVTSKPIQSFYSLTPRGKIVAGLFQQISESLESS